MRPLTPLLKRVNSGFMLYPLSRKKRWKERFGLGFRTKLDRGNSCFDRLWTALSTAGFGYPTEFFTSGITTLFADWIDTASAFRRRGAHATRATSTKSTPSTQSLRQDAGGFADYQLGSYFAVGGGHFAFFEDGINTVDDNADGGGAHGFHRLTHGGERRRVDSRGGDVIEANDGALLGDADARFVERTDGAK